MSEDLIKKIEEFLEKEVGNVDELKHILILLKEGKPLPQFDKKYLDKIFETRVSGYRGANSYKSEGTSLVLSLFFGLLGITGVGHRYIGNIRRSVAILYLGWALMITPLIFYFGVLTTAYQQLASRGLMYPQSLPQNDVTSMLQLFSTGLFLLIPLVTSLGYIALFIWQIFDSRNQTRKFNGYMDRTGIDFFEVTLGKKIGYAIALILPILTVLAYIGLVSLYLLTIQHSSSINNY